MMKMPRLLGRKIAFIGSVLLMTSFVFASGSASGSGGSGSAVGFEAISDRMQTQISSFTKLLITIAYVAGVGFGIGAIFKFKQHKDNPNQVPIGTPFAMFTVAVLLVFLPALFKPAKESVFGDKATGLSGPMTTTSTSSP
jgi:intracellular multiplication protein IcmD